MIRIAAVLAALTLTGCALFGGREPDAAPFVCDKDEFVHLMDLRPFDIDRDELPSPHRIIPFGDYVTLDHNPNRLNLWLNPEGRVSRITCE